MSCSFVVQQPERCGQMGPSKTGADDETQGLASAISLRNGALEKQCRLIRAAAVAIVDDGERLRAEQPIQQRRPHEACKATSFRILCIYPADHELCRYLRRRLDKRHRQVRGARTEQRKNKQKETRSSLVDRFANGGETHSTPVQGKLVDLYRIFSLASALSSSYVRNRYSISALFFLNRAPTQQPLSSYATSPFSMLLIL